MRVVLPLIVHIELNGLTPVSHVYKFLCSPQKYPVSWIAKRGRQNWQCYAKCMHFSLFYKCVICLGSGACALVDHQALELKNYRIV